MGQTLSLKYRPSSFNEVLGQREAVLVMRYAAFKNRDLKVFILGGSHGTGKTSLARLYAKALNCMSPTPDGDVCNTCESCQMFMRGTHNDYKEMDMGSRGGVQDMRRLGEEAVCRPLMNARVFVLDECHSASREAFNALLKLLEEPPASSAFVLCTTAMEEVPNTIVSRSLVLRLQALPKSTIIGGIKHFMKEEGVTGSDEVIDAIADTSNGSMRDCWMSIERILALSGGSTLSMDALQGEGWYAAYKAAPSLISAMVQKSRDAFMLAQESLSGRQSYEVLLRRSLDMTCKLYISKGKKPDFLTDALWQANIRLSRGMEPELVMDGLWLDVV